MTLLLLTVIALRLPMIRRDKTLKWLSVAGFFLIAITLWRNELTPLKLYPVLINAAMLIVFGASLVWPPSVIERLARLKTPDLPNDAVVYTRQVTRVWCLFFVFNGTVSLFTVLWASQEIWTIYNGVIAYVLMGFLFAGEFVFRSFFRKRRHV